MVLRLTLCFHKGMRVFRHLLIACLAVALPSARAALPPQPFKPVPTARQIHWQEMQMLAFLHFSINTFTDKEWGYGDESPKTFNPEGFDAGQIVGTLKQAGFRGIIFTVKHHDGFCLWPSKFTEHSVKNSPWKNGKGDVVREIADACRREGVAFGVYLSPWDRNHPEYGRDAYIAYYKNQLRELMTGYGPIFEFWMDNANGGDGYYGGVRETRRINHDTYYPWKEIWDTIHRLQPNTIIWGEIAPGCEVRWIGNEGGVAGNPCWTIVNPKMWIPRSELNLGVRDGSVWMPGEADVSIRPGWFYHRHEDDAVKSPARLMRLYFESVGRSTNLLLNVPPNRRGVIDEHDVKALREWRSILDRTFSTDLAPDAAAEATNVRGNDPEFAAGNVNDGKPDTYWATDDKAPQPALTLTFQKPVTFNVIRVREFLPLGQRVDDFAVDAETNGSWDTVIEAKQIGAQRILPTRFVTASKVRLRIVKAAACPAISEFALFKMSESAASVAIQRDRHGLVTLSTEFPGPWIRYTLDGSDPVNTSPLYKEPFPLPFGGTLKARAFSTAAESGPATVETFGAAKGKWKVRASFAAKDGPAKYLIDENPETNWNTWTPDNTQGAPQEAVINFGETLRLRGFTLLPRQDPMTKGTPDRYEIYVTNEQSRWGDPVATGEFSNIRASKELQTVLFKRTASGRFLRFVATHVLDDEKQVVVPEIGVIADKELSEH